MPPRWNLSNKRKLKELQDSEKISEDDTVTTVKDKFPDIFDKFSNKILNAHLKKCFDKGSEVLSEPSKSKYINQRLK